MARRTKPELAWQQAIHSNPLPTPGFCILL